MGRLWRIPVDEEKRTPQEQNTLELLNRFIDTACEILEKRGYVVVMEEERYCSPWIIKRIFVGRSDIVKEYLENRFGPIKRLEISSPLNHDV